MFSQDPLFLIPSAYLASDRLFSFALNQQTGCQNKTDFESTMKSSAQDYQFYFNSRMRKEDIDYAFQHWLPDKSPDKEFDCLKKISDEFLIWQGERFEVRSERLEEWLMLCSLLDPSWIIAYAFMELKKSKVLTEKNLIDIITGSQCPFALPSDKLQNSYADNHVHLNGHGYTSLSMMHFSLYLDREAKFSSKSWPRREEYTLFESGLLNKSLLPLWVAGYSDFLLSEIYGLNSKEINSDILSIEKLKALPSRNIVQIVKDISATSPSQRILQNTFQQGIYNHSSWLLFCCGLMLNYCGYNDKKNKIYSKGLANFIRVTNIFRNYMVVSAVGLGQFVEYSNFKYRKPNHKLSSEDSKNYDMSKFISREYRISPDFFVREAKGEKKGLVLCHQNLVSFASSYEQQKILENAHLVIHFTRGFPDKKNPHDKSLESFRKKLHSYVRKLQDFSSSTTMSDVVNCSDIYAEPLNLDVRKLIRGYDVAGNENELPVEVFAPALRVLRAGKHNSTSDFTCRLPLPFITVHAGEDYSHLLSGLRSIDEAVEFCQLRDGDRIGHGLALGIDVYQWAKRQRRAYLTAGQHLDNLVWCYYQAMLLSQYMSDHLPVMHLLREKIHFWCNHIWGEIYTPNELYQAWLLRRNWPEYESIMKDEPVNGNQWVPDGTLIDNPEKKRITQLWMNYINSGMPENRQKFHTLLSINCAPENGNIVFPSGVDNSDSISPGELKLYEAIQDFLMSKYSRLGITIETCPTSNIYIGRLNKYEEHPIFRWNPPNPDWLKPGERFNRYGLRSGPLSVCINTDDCVLMPTTIANEHRIIRENAIQYFGVSAWMADIWIDSIRNKGVEIFKRNHLNQVC